MTSPCLCSANLSAVVRSGSLRQSRTKWGSGRYIRISVSDTGIGMDRETIEHIFEPFFTTKSRGEGTGLGLSTVHGIVKQHNGLINASSQVGEGSTIDIYLPSVEKPAETESTTTDGSLRGGGETILMAEDDEMIRELAGRILKGAGYTVITAFDGNDAVRVFEQNRARIDMVLLDVMMPGRDGRAVRDYILSRNPDMPVLFASGYADDTIHESFLNEEDVDLIQKPYKRDQLLSEIRRVMECVKT